MEAAITTQLQQPTDAVIAFELGMDAYIPPLPTGVPLIIDQVELSGVERAFRQAGTWQTRFRTGLTYVKSATYWRRRLSRYALLTVVSEAEAVAVRQVSGPASRIVIVPNGVDISAYPSEPSPHRTMGQLLYNGALTYGPNQDAALWFVQEILPIIRTTVPQARLTITGRCPLEGVMGVSDHPHVTLTGFLPDLRPTLTASQVAVVSLRSGGGTRLKIIEAFAAHLPVVSTTVGAAGLGVESGTHLFLADTPADFAEATIRLLCNPTLAARIAANARQLAAEHFNWRAIGKSLSAHIEQTVIEATA
jgi:glycosyltransferase involved in cell wall biosynthesis